VTAFCHSNFLNFAAIFGVSCTLVLAGVSHLTQTQIGRHVSTRDTTDLSFTLRTSDTQTGGHVSLRTEMEGQIEGSRGGGGGDDTGGGATRDQVLRAALPPSHPHLEHPTPSHASQPHLRQRLTGQGGGEGGDEGGGEGCWVGAGGVDMEMEAESEKGSSDGAVDMGRRSLLVAPEGGKGGGYGEGGWIEEDRWLWLNAMASGVLLVILIALYTVFR
jgi:hypothetical protein